MEEEKKFSLFQLKSLENFFSSCGERISGGTSRAEQKMISGKLKTVHSVSVH